jgi:hypothetical protein
MLLEQISPKHQHDDGDAMLTREAEPSGIRPFRHMSNVVPGLGRIKGSNPETFNYVLPDMAAGTVGKMAFIDPPRETVPEES